MPPRLPPSYLPWDQRSFCSNRRGKTGDEQLTEGGLWCKQARGEAKHGPEFPKWFLIYLYFTAEERGKIQQTLTVKESRLCSWT